MEITPLRRLLNRFITGDISLLALRGDFYSLLHADSVIDADESQYSLVSMHLGILLRQHMA